MAKNKNTEEATVTVTSTEVASTKKTRVINNVTMTDGSVKNFGERGKLLSSQVVHENGFDLTFHLITGEQIEFKHETTADSLTLEMAAFGAAAKVKAATAGTKQEDLAAVVSAKLEEFKQGLFVTRAAGGEVSTPLSHIQTAYAIVNGIDTTTTEGVATVNAVFAALNKQQRSALYSNPKIKLELVKIQMAKAQADLENSLVSG